MDDHKNQQQQQPQEQQHTLARCANWFHTTVSAPLFVTIVSLYALDWGDWTAFILVPASLIELCDLLYQLPVFFWNKTWIKALWRFLKWLLKGSWAKAILRVQRLKELWFGRVSV